MTEASPVEAAITAAGSRPPPGSWRSALWPAGVIAAVPGLAYYLAFTYEKGVGRIYGYPTGLINLQIGSVFVAMGALTFFAISLYALAGPVHTVWPRPVGPLTYYFAPALGLLAFGLTFVVIFGPRLSRIWYVFAIAAVVFLIHAGLPLFTQRNHSGLRQKFAAQWVGDAQSTERMLSHLIFDRLGWLGFAFVGILILTGWAESLGEASALNRTDYLTFGDGGIDYAVVAIYGSEVVAEPLNRKGRTLADKLLVTNMDASHPLRLTWENLGRLNLEGRRTHEN